MSESLDLISNDPVTVRTIHHDSDAEFIGQVGAGYEVRLTRHIGFINDFSWRTRFLLTQARRELTGRVVKNNKA